MHIYDALDNIHFAANWNKGTVLFLAAWVNVTKSFHLHWLGFVCMSWWHEFQLECIGLVSGAWVAYCRFSCIFFIFLLSSLFCILNNCSYAVLFLTISAVLTFHVATTKTNDMPTSKIYLQLISGTYYKTMHISNGSKSNPSQKNTPQNNTSPNKRKTIRKQQTTTTNNKYIIINTYTLTTPTNAR